MLQQEWGGRSLLPPCESGPRDRTEVLRFGGKSLYPVRHLTDPSVVSLSQHQILINMKLFVAGRSLILLMPPKVAALCLRA